MHRFFQNATSCIVNKGYTWLVLFHYCLALIAVATFILVNANLVGFICVDKRYCTAAGL
jgi:hypothetical protein